MAQVLHRVWWREGSGGVFAVCAERAAEWHWPEAHLVQVQGVPDG